ncbi:MAG: hypothetical protein ACODUE_12645 [Synechococcus sp.]
MSYLSTAARIKRLIAVVIETDAVMHDGVAPGGCHDQFHPSAKAAGELFLAPEVGISQA